MINRLIKTFLAGAAVSIPIIITIWVVLAAGTWLGEKVFAIAENLFAPLQDMPEESYLRSPWIWVFVVLGLIFLVGIATRFWFFAKLLKLVEVILERVPLVKTVYTSVRDMLRFFSGEEGAIGKVVLYKVPGQEIRMLAILTNEKPIALPPDRAKGMVAIWLPMSYQLGGYMLYVPADTVEPIDMSVEEVMKLAATAEIGARRLLPHISVGKPAAAAPAKAK